jgi:hypothetical protein
VALLLVALPEILSFRHSLSSLVHSFVASSSVAFLGVDMIGKAPLAMGSRSEGAHVAGEVYGPFLSDSKLSSSAFFSAHAIAPSTATFTPWTTISTTLAADSVPSIRCANGLEGCSGVSERTLWCFDYAALEGVESLAWLLTSSFCDEVPSICAVPASGVDVIAASSAFGLIVCPTMASSPSGFIFDGLDERVQIRTC